MSRRAFAVLLASITGCALVDARQNLCEKRSHCGREMVCTTEGCQPIDELGVAAVCDEHSDCQANRIEADAVDPSGIDCPAGRVCECHAGGCVYRSADPPSCSSSDDCGTGYCDNSDSACYWAFTCGSHNDCTYDELCTAEGCRYLGDTSCSVGCTPGICIGALYCFLQTAVPCHATADCAAGKHCMLPEGLCFDPDLPAE